jgi:hypothetical protein
MTTTTSTTSDAPQESDPRADKADVLMLQASLHQITGYLTGLAFYPDKKKRSLDDVTRLDAITGKTVSRSTITLEYFKKHDDIVRLFRHTLSKLLPQVVVEVKPSERDAESSLCIYFHIWS